jgi:predicted aspartyl protease
MQVQLTINGHDFLALLDSGSTRNFIDSETAEALHLNRLEAPDNITIVVANDS